jgi:hypothetical protein
VYVNAVAVRNFAGPQLDTELALAVAAIRSEMPTFCRHWNLPLVGVSYYGASHQGDMAEQAVVSVVASTGDPEAFARHTQLGRAVYGYVDADLCASGAEPLPRALSHEIWELSADPGLDRSEPLPDGTSVLREVSDPPNRISLPVEAEFFGRSGVVPLSDYVLPAWYVPGSKGPWDRAGALNGPLEDGPSGYHQVLRGRVVVASGASVRISSFGRTVRRLVAAR